MQHDRIVSMLSSLSGLHLPPTHPPRELSACNAMILTYVILLCRHCWWQLKERMHSLNFIDALSARLNRSINRLDTISSKWKTPQSPEKSPWIVRSDPPPDQSTETERSITLTRIGRLTNSQVMYIDSKVFVKLSRPITDSFDCTRVHSKWRKPMRAQEMERLKEIDWFFRRREKQNNAAYLHKARERRRMNSHVWSVRGVVNDLMSIQMIENRRRG